MILLTGCHQFIKLEQIKYDLPADMDSCMRCLLRRNMDVCVISYDDVCVPEEACNKSDKGGKIFTINGY